MNLIQDAVSFTKLFPEAVLCGTVMAAVCSYIGDGFRAEVLGTQQGGIAVAGASRLRQR